MSTEHSPNIVYGEPSADAVHVESADVAQIMHELDIPGDTIDKTTIYIDPSNKLATNGVTYPPGLGQARFAKIPELHEAPGRIVSLGTTMRGRPRSSEAMNRTLVHELEHVAQGERDKKELAKGVAVMAGLAVAGALTGNLLAKGRSNFARSAATAIGGAAGYELGYKMSPHERGARAKSQEVTTRAISRLSD